MTVDSTEQQKCHPNGSGSIRCRSRQSSKPRPPKPNQLVLYGRQVVLVVVLALILPLITGHFHQNVQAQLLANKNLLSQQHPFASAQQQIPLASLQPQIEPQANTYTRRNSLPEALDIIKQRGFIGERYRVRSRLDGHPLVLFHIINPFADPTKLNKYPVLYAHGLAGDSSQSLGPSRNSQPRKPIPGQLNYNTTSDDNVAFTLSNNNFDVWLMDARGVTLNDHDPDVDYDPIKGAKFWNFSLDEQAQADLPSFIDFVLEQTQTDKLHYIGYSQTTLMSFALMSWQPAYQDKLASVANMAPIAYFHHATGPVINVFLPTLMMPDNIGFNFLPQLATDSVDYSIGVLCSSPLLAETICKNLESAAFGFGVGRTDSSGFDATGLRKTSIKAIKHFIQLFLQHRFGMFDYGPKGNIAKYGHPVPPNYNLKNIVLPRIVLFRGGVDMVARVQDQQLLISQMGAPVYADILLPDYNHLDFLVSETRLRDVIRPMTNIFFQHLLDLNPTGNIFRNALKSRSPAFNPVARAPEAVARPDGTKDAYQERSLMLHNIVRGIYGTGDSSNPDRNLGALAPKASTSPLDPIRNVAKSLLPVKAIDGYAKLLDGFMEIPGAIFHKLH